MTEGIQSSDNPLDEVVFIEMDKYKVQNLAGS